MNKGPINLKLSVQYDKQLDMSQGIALPTNKQQVQIVQNTKNIQPIFSNPDLAKRTFFIALDEFGAYINPKLRMRSLCFAPPGYELEKILVRSLVDIRKTKHIKKVIQSQSNCQLVQLGYQKRMPNQTQVTVTTTGYIASPLGTSIKDSNFIQKFEDSVVYKFFKSQYGINLNIQNSQFTGQQLVQYPVIDLNDVYYTFLQQDTSPLKSAFNNEYDNNPNQVISILKNLVKQDTDLIPNYQNLQSKISTYKSTMIQSFLSDMQQVGGKDVSQSTDTQLVLQYQKDIQQVDDFSQQIWDYLMVFENIGDLTPVQTMRWNKPALKFIDFNNKLTEAPYIGVQGIVIKDKQQNQLYLQSRVSSDSQPVLLLDLFGNQYVKMETGQYLCGHLQQINNYSGWIDQFGSLPVNSAPFACDNMTMIPVTNNNIPSRQYFVSNKQNEGLQVGTIVFNKPNTRIPAGMKLIGIGEQLDSQQLILIYAYDSDMGEILNTNTPSINYLQNPQYLQTFKKSDGFMSFNILNSTVQYGTIISPINQLPLAVIQFDYTDLLKSQISKLQQYIQSQSATNYANEAGIQLNNNPNLSILATVIGLVILIVSVVVFIMIRRKEQNPQQTKFTDTIKQN